MEKTHLNGSIPSTPTAKPKRPHPKETFEEVPISRAILTYMQYGINIFWGYISDCFRRIGLRKDVCLKNDDMFKIGLEFESFYNRNIYRKIRDCWNRPVGGCPGSHIDLVDRESEDTFWTFTYPGTVTHCLNMGSYNYLGFAETTGPCADASIGAIHEYGAGNCSPRRELGTLHITRELEKTTARFLGKQDALVFGMGFGTNSTNIPALMGKGSLIVSDALNHASIVTGAKISGATIRVFKHNDMKSLESVLRNAIVKGQPRTHKPWKKILIVVEGIYSMEGSVPRLPEIVELKKKYKANIYLDEAHSIGAMGPTGRGVVEYLGVDPDDVDIMMGTFTKSFGGCGGYIAANYDIINYLRHQSHAATYGSSMPAPVAAQVLTAMKIIMGEDGTNEGQKRVTQLIDNSRYFRSELIKRGFIVYGNHESPVVPVLLYEPAKLSYFSRELRKRKIAVVVVGYPATTIVEGRCRICLSASHTKEMLDFALKEIDEVGEMIAIKKNSFAF